MNKELPNFQDIHLQAQDYWGPNHLPFAPFNKLDKVSKYCDFESKVVENFIQVENKQKTTQPAYYRRRQQQIQRAINNQFAEESAQINQGFIKNVNLSLISGFKKQKQQKKKVQNRYNYQRPVYHKTKFKDNTILTQSWKIIGEISKSTFDVKANQIGLIKTKDLFKIGTVWQYNTKFDKLKAAKQKPIFSLQKQAIANLPLDQDDHLKGLSEKLRELNNNFESLLPKQEEEAKAKIKELAYVQQPMIFTSDTVLTAIMALQHSNFPFEILIRKEGNQMFMDKSTNPNNLFNSYIDLMSANENVVNIPEEEKEIAKQCIESTLIHHTLPSVLLNKDNTEFKICLPEEDILSDFLQKLPTTGFSERQMLYKYRHVSIENKFNVFVRCSCNGKCNNNEIQLLMLNEFTPELQQWKQNLEQKLGLILMEELRSNIYKATRWICQGILSGVDLFKLAFVAKETEKSYQLLLVETYQLEELMKMLNFREKDCWYYVKQIIEFIAKQPDGQFVLKKPPFVQKFEVYRQEKDEAEWEQEKDK